MPLTPKPRMNHHTAGVDPTLWWDFQPGERVRVIEGFLGTVTAVEDGPHAGNEQYQVLLDDGMGGGAYRSSELTSIEHVQASAQTPIDSPDLSTFDPTGLHLASEDYPALQEILIERPPLENVRVTASKQSEGFQVEDSEGNVRWGPTPLAVDAARQMLEMTEGGIDGLVIRSTSGIVDKVIDYANDHVDPSIKHHPGNDWSYDWCKFRHNERCMYPKGLDVPATKKAGYAVWIPVDRGYCPRGTWDAQKACPVGAPGPKSGDPNAQPDATVSWEDGGQRVSIQTKADLDDQQSGGVDGYQAAMASALGGDQMANPANVSEAYMRGWRAGWERGIADLNEHTASFSNDSLTSDDGSFGCPYCQGLGVGGIYGVQRLGNMCGRCKGYGILDIKLASEINKSAEVTGDGEWGWHFTAAWRDVQEKAKRIRAEGYVRIIAATPGYVTAEVRGDTNIYQTTIVRVPGGKTTAWWECGCAWANYAWARSGRWKRYEGRMCAHALATNYEAQSQEFNGGTVIEQRMAPKWRNDPTLPIVTPGDNRTKPTPWRVGSLDGVTSSMHEASTDSSLALSLDEAIRREADVKAKIRGVIETIEAIVGHDKVKLTNGETVPVSEVVHPSYDPRAGLDYHEAKMAAASGQAWDGQGHLVTIDPGETWYSHTDGSIGEPDGTSPSDGGIWVLDPATGDETWRVCPEHGADACEDGAVSSMCQHGDCTWQNLYLGYGLHPLEAKSASASDLVTFTDESLYTMLGEVALPPYPDGDGGVVAAGLDQDCAPIAQHLIDKVEQYRIGSLRVIAADGPDMDGCMIALRPPDSVCGALAQDGGEDIENMHVTIAYLGKSADLDLDRLESVVSAFSFGAPTLTGRVGGMGVFDNPQGKVLVALVDIPGLPEWRERLVDYLEDAGFEIPGDHGFTPHLTIAYTDDQPDLPEVPAGAKDDFTLDQFVLACGADWTYYAMGSGSDIEVAAALTEYHEAPEPALPSTDGAETCPACGGSPCTCGQTLGGKHAAENHEIALIAQQVAKHGMKIFSPAEQRAIINEGEGVTASNLDQLDIEGTHYQALEAAFVADEDTMNPEDLWLDF